LRSWRLRGSKIFAFCTQISLVRYYHPRPHGVQDHVPAEFEEVAFLIDEDGLEAALKEMAGLVVPAVVSLGIDAVELAHTHGEIGVWGLDQEVAMIVHETVGMAKPVVSFDHGIQDREEALSVLVIGEDLASCIASRGHMVDGPRTFYS